MFFLECGGCLCHFTKLIRFGSLFSGTSIEFNYKDFILSGFSVPIVSSKRVHILTSNQHLHLFVHLCVCTFYSMSINKGIHVPMKVIL